MSPNYPLAYNHDAVCEWIIHVSKGSRVSVQLMDVDFEVIEQSCSDDYLEFYDGNSDRSPIIRKVCKLESNGAIMSTKNVMFIKFQTDSRISYRGFRLQYTTHCSAQLSGYRGVIESPNFPEFPVGQVNCSWIVSVPIGHNITFTFSHQNISNDNGCSVINTTNTKKANEINNLIFDICAIKDKVVPSLFNVSSNVAVIQFFRKTMSTKFRMEWYAVGCGGEFVNKRYGTFESPNYPNGYPKDTECLWHITVDLKEHVVLYFHEFSLEVQPAVGQCNSDFVSVYSGPDVNSPLLTTLCDKLTKSLTISSSGNQMTVRFKSDNSVSGRGFSASFQAQPGACGGVFENNQGSLTSKNYPSKYDATDDCEWLITVTGMHKIQLKFDDFDLPENTDCSSSYIIVYDGVSESSPSLLKHCGKTLPTVVLSTSNSMLIRLKSDGISAAKGFKASYKAICGGTIVVSRDDHSSHELLSSNYPYESVDIDFCNWTLTAENPSDKIILTFTNIISEKLNDCSENYVEVKEGDSENGPLIARYCGTQIPPPIISSGNSLHVYLHENAVFRAVFTTAISTCGGLLDSETGTFVSPGYPNDYPLNVECVWTLECSPGNRVSLSFTDFHIEQSEYCKSDYVEIRENDFSGKLIGRFCGNSIPNLHELSANVLWVKFRSDELSSSQGFRAVYSLLHGVDITGTSG
ncbi:Cubilin-like protein, partial [Leptotrombidium deliense]